MSGHVADRAPGPRGQASGQTPAREGLLREVPAKQAAGSGGKPTPCRPLSMNRNRLPKKGPVPSRWLRLGFKSSRRLPSVLPVDPLGAAGAPDGRAARKVPVHAQSKAPGVVGSTRGSPDGAEGAHVATSFWKSRVCTSGTEGRQGPRAHGTGSQRGRAHTPAWLPGSRAFGARC